MTFGHQRLDVYQDAIRFVTWSHDRLQHIEAAGSARNQLERAAASIPLNIAEGNVKSSPRDRRRYFEIALGSTVECAAILDVLVARCVQGVDDVAAGKEALRIIASRLIRLIHSIEDAAGQGQESGQGRG